MLHIFAFVKQFGQLVQQIALRYQINYSLKVLPDWVLDGLLPSKLIEVYWWVTLSTSIVQVPFFSLSLDLSSIWCF